MSDRIGAIDIETSKSGRAASLKTLAAEPRAIADIETSQLCAKGEQFTDGSVTHFVAVKENERFELAAAFSQLDQAPTAQLKMAL